MNLLILSTCFNLQPRDLVFEFNAVFPYFPPFPHEGRQVKLG